MDKAHRDPTVFALLAGALLAGALLICAPPAFAGQPHTADWRDLVSKRQEEALQKAEREEMAVEVMSLREELVGRNFDSTWAARQVERLTALPMAELEAMLAGLHGGEWIGMPRTAQTKQLGDNLADLVYTPLDKNCRVVDSRKDGLTGNVARDMPYPLLVAGDLTAGGELNQGAGGNCGIPFGPTKAVVANIVAVVPDSRGNAQAWSWDGTAKGDAVVNFGGPESNFNQINGVVIRVCDNDVSACDFDLFVEFNNTSSDLVVNVAGYMAEPEVTPLDCMTISKTFKVSPGFWFNQTSGTCPTDYALTGGGYNYTETLEKIFVWQASPAESTQEFLCRGINTDATETETFECYGRCCRVGQVARFPPLHFPQGDAAS